MRRRVGRSVLLAAATLVALSGCSPADDQIPSATPATTPEPTSEATTAPPTSATPSTTTPSTTTPSTTTTTTTTAAPGPACRRITEFQGEAQQRWAVTLDGVMGGLSSGRVDFSASAMTFTGEIVTQGGGFSLLRTALDGDEFLDGSFLVVRARTDGRGYEMVFKDRVEGRRSQLFHEAIVPFTDSTDWQEVRVELDGLLTTSNGLIVDAEPFAKNSVREMGIILKDGVDGRFALDVDWIDICSPV